VTKSFRVGSLGTINIGPVDPRNITHTCGAPLGRACLHGSSAKA
jgi:hypothetical protein